MSAHLSSPEHRILSIVGPVGNNTLQAVGIGAAVKHAPHQPIVVCSVGDGTTQQGEFFEGVHEAARTQVPVLFVIEDNHYAISTRTSGQTFFNGESKSASQHLGVPILRANGADFDELDSLWGQCVSHVRFQRQPAIAILDVRRLANHTNADDQSRYRSQFEIEGAMNTGDPIKNLRAQLLHKGVSVTDLEAIETAVRNQVSTAVEEALNQPRPTCSTVSKLPLPVQMRACVSGFSVSEFRSRKSVSMREALCETLLRHLETDPRIVLFGQDIEDPKGDVFGVTRGLSTQFPGRVLNAPLSESTIVGTCIGRALAGQKPIAFIQFADFLPLAFNQIASELGTMYWRTDGKWQCPVVIMATCGAYKPGLGPFHAQTLESMMAHTPGLDVVMPSSAADTSGLLNTVLASGRPTLFLYPKARLGDIQATTTDSEAAEHYVPLGRGKHLRAGSDITLVTWGTTVRLAQEAVELLNDAEVSVDLIDLRSISPWDEDMVCRSCEITGRLLVVHEDNRTCGFGAEVVATAVEKCTRSLQAQRLTRPDVPIPCNFQNQLELLPSVESILQAIQKWLPIEIVQVHNTETSRDCGYVFAIASGPSDEYVKVVELAVKVGDTVHAGQRLGLIEATKSIVDIVSPHSGVVLRILAAEQHQIRVGSPILELGLQASGDQPSINHNQERDSTTFRVRRRRLNSMSLASSKTPSLGRMGLAGIQVALGKKSVSNADLVEEFPERNSAQIESLTGISSRCWCQPHETVLSLGVEATMKLLTSQKLQVNDLDLVIVATTTPDMITPSLACRIIHALADGRDSGVPAYDINAACSGWLYAASQAFEFLQSRPDARVLVVTSEVLSRKLSKSDFATRVLFGDAATASLFVGANAMRPDCVSFSRPLISGAVDSELSIQVPLGSCTPIQMQGERVFRKAVRSMTEIAREICSLENLDLNQIDWIVPHQANGRILDYLRQHLDRPVLDCIANYGNTSSSSIPLAMFLSKVSGRLLFVSFAGGFVSGGCYAVAPGCPESPESDRDAGAKT